jgi:hypothetical protein
MNDAITAPDSAVGESLRAYALNQFDVIATMLARRGDELDEGIHEARKSVRHIRATLHLCRKPLGVQASDAIDGLKQLNESLSTIRDAAVAVQIVDALIASTADVARRRLLRRIRRAFATQRAAQFEALRDEDPDLGRRLAAARQLRDQVAALNWSNVLPTSVHAELARSMRRARHLGERAHDSHKGTLRHRWRRRLRRLRHQLRIVETELGWLLSTRESWSWPDPRSDDPGAQVLVEVRPRTLHAITDRLGFEHDLRMVRVALRRADGIEPADRAEAVKIVRTAIADALN